MTKSTTTKTACITGASSGIGREFALQLASRGFDLILIARNEKALEALADELPANSTIYTCDFTDTRSVLELSEKLVNERIDILINNAGFGDLGAFYEADLDKSLDMIKVNITALHILTRKLLPGFIKRDKGYILNVASSAGLLPGGPYMSTYYATKAYVTSLTSAIHRELEDICSNVHISMLCPGPVDTNFNEVVNVSFALPGISAKYCVKCALKGMAKGRLTIVPSLTMKSATHFSRFLPRKILLEITAKQQKKKQ